MIDQLDNEGVRDAAVLAAERARADDDVPAAAGEAAESLDEQPPSDMGRERAAESLKNIESEFERVARAGLCPHTPVQQTDVEPLARAVTAVATELSAFVANTRVGQGHGSGVQVWPAETRDDSVATKLRSVAFGLRHEPAVVFGDLVAKLHAKTSHSRRSSGSQADGDSNFV